VEVRGEKVKSTDTGCVAGSPAVGVGAAPAVAGRN
jgi:hypothetical protein